MARTVRDTNLEKSAARLRLDARRKPYWRVLESGLHLGYRRTKEGGGSWVARRFIGDGKYKEHVFGVADDLQSADGVTILTFFRRPGEGAGMVESGRARGPSGSRPSAVLTLSLSTLEAYFVERARRGSKRVNKGRASSKARIMPELGHGRAGPSSPRSASAIGNRPWRPRQNSHAPGKSRITARSHAVDLTDADAVRARRATANRILTVLKAALNHAFQESRIGSDEAWRKVKPFREADAPVVHFLSDDECRRIVNACDGAFRNIVKGALLTGCRYSELARMRAGDFNAEAGTITVRESKSGKPRHVVLTDEGRALFAELTAGHAARDMVFVRDDGNAWGESHQQRPLEAASNHAKIEPTATFHILRHSYASSLAMRGVPMGVIAAQLGHSDTRMTERHYAHLSPNYVADTVRAALPALGIVEKSSVEPLKRQA